MTTMLTTKIIGVNFNQIVKVAKIGKGVSGKTFPATGVSGNDYSGNE